MIESTTCSRREALGAVLLGGLALRAQDPVPARVPERVLHSRTVVFVRHAEKDETDTADKKDPELTELGRQRAAKLAGMFGAAGVQSVFATEFRRTQHTLAPLAARAGAKVESYAARDSEKFAAALGVASESAMGGTVVVAGHSNTVPQMVKALGGHLGNLTEKGWFEDAEYERVVIVALCGPKGEPMRAVSTVDIRLEL